MIPKQVGEAIDRPSLDLVRAVFTARVLTDGVLELPFGGDYYDLESEEALHEADGHLRGQFDETQVQPPHRIGG